MVRFRERIASLWMLLLLLMLLPQHLELGASLNDEGRALLKFWEAVEVDPYGSLLNWVDVEHEDDPCSWLGVACEGGKVVSLVLENLNLKGTLTPELKKLVHLKYLILNDNSFHGIVPREIGELQKLEELDLRYNNFHGALPSDLENLLSLKVLRGTPIPHDLSELEVKNNPFSSSGRSLSSTRGDASSRRRLLGVGQSRALSTPEQEPHPSAPPPSHDKQNPSQPSPQSSSTRRENGTSPSPPPPPPPPPTFAPPPPLPLTSSSSFNTSPPKKNILPYTLVGVGGGFLIMVAILVIFCQKNKVNVVKPWVTGLSGQLQKAFVTGLPSLKQSEVEAACEGFSNVIGSLSDGTLYKGTLSNGVEIAVSVIKSDGNWTKRSQTQFRKKIKTLSKVNHKNFVNLIGYCEGEAPFSRMMVFEYAPNGTLFEHLHVKEAEHLDWAARLRIAMGVAYCLDHMHQLNPPVVLQNLDSNSILLTDDFAAKVADLELQSETTCGEMCSGTSGHLAYQMPDQQSVVFKFGIILLELVSGRLSYSDENGELVSWASDYLKGSKPLEEMIDPTLTSFDMDIIRAICNVIQSCLNPDPKGRPLMKDVVTELKNVTAVTPDGAYPRLSPLWWAELEIISSAAN